MAGSPHQKGSSKMILLAVAVGFLVVAALVVVDFLSSPMVVVSASPSDGQVDVDLYPVVEIEFSNTVEEDSFLSNVDMSPPMMGEWEISGGMCSFKVVGRLDSNTEYMIIVNGNFLSGDSEPMKEDYVLSFTTGNTSSRVVGNGTSAQLDYIAYDEDGRVFATSMSSVANDEVNYAKSPLYIDVYKERLGKLRKFPVIVGKETEFKVIEDNVLGMKIGESVELTLGPDEIFGTENQSLIYQKNLSEAVNYTEVVSYDTAVDAFLGNFTAGAKGVHPLWGWNVTLVSSTNMSAIITNEPVDGMVTQPYGWDTIVSTNQNNISLQHQVNDTHVYDIMGVSGTFPEHLFMVREVNVTGGYAVLDENWPPVICGQTTHWEITVYDIEISEN